MTAQTPKGCGGSVSPVPLPGLREKADAPSWCQARSHCDLDRLEADVPISGVDGSFEKPVRDGYPILAVTRAFACVFSALTPLHCRFTRETGQKGMLTRRASRLDPYIKPKIDEPLCAGVWNAVVIWREIQALGYDAPNCGCANANNLAKAALPRSTGLGLLSNPKQPDARTRHLDPLWS